MSRLESYLATALPAVVAGLFVAIGDATGAIAQESKPAVDINSRDVK